MTWHESLEMACAAHAKKSSQHILHFATIVPRMQNCFFTLSHCLFQRLTEDPVKVLKVGVGFLYVELHVERLIGINPALGCGGKAEG